MNARAGHEESAALFADVERRIDAIDASRLEANLDAFGNAVVERMLSASECAALASLYPRDDSFRSRVVMARRGYGRGEYKYFAYPLPALVGALRETLYARLAGIANRWYEAMRIDVRFPVRHAQFLARCHAAGQRRPTPLMLSYRAGDYIYGEHVFPLQATILLSQPGRDFGGGEFVMIEQRPRMQSRAEAIPLAHGDAVIFAVRERPVRGTRGIHRVNLRHGVSRIRSGERRTLGIIFHDAA